MSPEGLIEDRIIQDTAALGYPAADAIRRCRVGRYVGIVDLMLLPVEGDRKMVLIEVKTGDNAEGQAKVIGQLLLYLTGALKIGTDGLDLMRNFARTRPDDALRESMTSLKMLSGGISPPDAAWATLRGGDRISAEQIHLLIGLDVEPSNQLKEALRLLDGYGLRIEVVTAAPDSPLLVWTPA